MPNPDVIVKLDLRNWTPGGPGYTTATGNTAYSYKFSEGSDGTGSFEFPASGRGRGTKWVKVELIADPRYSIMDVQISGDTNNQLSTPPGQQSLRSWMIKDLDSIAENGYFSVTCSFNAPPLATNIVCDPLWKND